MGHPGLHEMGVELRVARSLAIFIASVSRERDHQ